MISTSAHTARRGDATAGNAEVLAVGDLMLAGGSSDTGQPRRQIECLRSLRQQLGHADVVFANLETTLPGNEGTIPKEPRLQAERESLAAALSALGAGIVSLANNHAFDCYASGFSAVESVLAELGVSAFGAGLDADAAARPAIIARAGVRIGWLGYVALDTRPSHVAATASYGANPLEPGAAVEQISILSRQVDHVLVSLHWGVEYCHLPSPDQIAVARRLIDAGARAVIGHHAHVAQGVERHGSGLIAYGLGNAVSTDLQIGNRLAIKQSRRTHSALALRLNLSKTELTRFEVLPYRMTAGGARVNDRYAQRVFERANAAIADGVTNPQWRRRRFFEDVILRPLWKLDPRVIRSLNLGHARKLAAHFARASRLPSGAD